MVTIRRRVAPSGTGVIPATAPGTVGSFAVARRGPVIVRELEPGVPGSPADDGFFASVMTKPSLRRPKNAYYARSAQVVKPFCSQNANVDAKDAPGDELVPLACRQPKPAKG